MLENEVKWRMKNMTDMLRNVRITSLNGHDEIEDQTLEGAQAIMGQNPSMWAFLEGKMVSSQNLVERWNDAAEGATVDLVRPLVGGSC